MNHETGHGIADRPFDTIAECIRRHAQDRPDAPALSDDDHTLDYAALDARMDRVAAALQRDGLVPGDAIALCGAPSVVQALVFLGALRAGVVVAPLAPGSTPSSLARMVADAQARRLFVDASTAGDFAASMVPVTRLDDGFEAWMGPIGSSPLAVTIAPESPFNIIYSSGTTGEPKGIVQPHGMRWAHVRRGLPYGYGPGAVTLLATPLYSNTTLVVFFPSLAFGGSVVLMRKFDTLGYLQLAERVRATHTMLVPVQYQRLMAQADFGRFDLSSFRMKFSTSAPFSAALKADVLARWPGGLVEFYGMTEGGGTCLLEAHLHPDKLHTVGRPALGTDVRLIDEAGHELPAGMADATGEVVGHSPGMMVGYHGRPEATREAEWFDATGKRFIRTGDIGRFDADGFLILMDRRKDMIISGGFNIYPSDLEAQLREHPAVAEVAVVGVPSEQWGETPVAFVVRRAADDTAAEALRAWLNGRVGKTQRLAAVHLVDELPRSAIGKVLKRELRERHALYSVAKVDR
ncbi:class I adenylate-forming enzyme family protein [Piscinibacter sp.]|uniref:class I adenylate-forming enzyme family protein n=1 Tax=Piscinibacter sp. TaxID=1903157 RepID=UPI001D29661E|nr:class I adenylate-forming enzyme family protein [Piscinibacter sp.]MBK7529140.1 acyl--CoA ligase [Piscinibacter sp.]